jgi:putative thioredoxin
MLYDKTRNEKSRHTPTSGRLLQMLCIKTALLRFIKQYQMTTMTTFNITDFQRDVIDRSHSIPVLVDFWAEWCAPCRILGPMLERLAEKYDGIWELRKVDTEAFPEVARTYGIRSIPNVKLFVNGSPVNEFVGALPETSIEQWLKTALPDRHESALRTAGQLMRDHRDAEARVLLEEVLRDAPEHDQARALLATSLFFEDRARAQALVEHVDTGGATGERIAALRTFNALLTQAESDGLPDTAVRQAFLSALDAVRSQDFDAALDGFISIIRTDRYYNDDSARKACIAIFKYLGEDHEITLKYRRDFDRSLY